ncbi:MAG: TauD/TfdA dioxygenase family protein [Burkholderiaceae bacterium]
MDYRHIEVSPVTPTLGAMISGVDLNAVRNQAVYEEIRQALWKHQVIFFRNQALTPAAHLALGGAFGEMEKHEFFPHIDSAPEIQVVSNDGSKSPDTDRWHADVTFRERPTAVTLLRAVDIPPSGGDTTWASMTAAFEALDEPMRKMLLELDAEHDISFAWRRMGFIDDARRLDRTNPPYIHPAVINHPVTGKLCLFVNSVWTKRFTNLIDRYGENLLRLLNEWIMKPEFAVRFRWERDSLAIWDNLATQHYAVFDYPGHSRRMHRITCAPTKVRLDARQDASRPAPIATRYEDPYVSPMLMGAPDQRSVGQAAASQAPSIIDGARVEAQSEPDRAAVEAVLQAIARIDLDELVRRATQV